MPAENSTSSTNISTDKQPVASKSALRKKMRLRRRSLNSRQQKQAALGLAGHLCQHSSFLNSKRIAFYLANDGEISTRPLIELAWKMGKEVYLPVLHPVLKNRMWFVHYSKNSKMQKNIFGIIEPNPKFNHRVPARTLGMVGLPLVAFDQAGGRLGMGGGFYDRSFAFKKTTRGQTPRLIGLAHSCQETAKLALEPWDIPLSAVATDAGIIAAA